MPLYLPYHYCLMSLLPLALKLLLLPLLPLLNLLSSVPKHYFHNSHLLILTVTVFIVTIIITVVIITISTTTAGIITINTATAAIITILTQRFRFLWRSLEIENDYPENEGGISCMPRRIIFLGVMPLGGFGRNFNFWNAMPIAFLYYFFVLILFTLLT